MRKIYPILTGALLLFALGLRAQETNGPATKIENFHML